MAIFCISVLDTYVEKNAISHNVTKQPVSKHTEMIDDDSDNAILPLR